MMVMMVMVVVAWLPAMAGKRRGEGGSCWTGDCDRDIGCKKCIKVVDEHFLVTAAAATTTTLSGRALVVVVIIAV